MPTRYLYRLTDGARVSDFRGATIHTAAYPITRETAKCYVIAWGGGASEKFILKDQLGKRFAYRSLEDARKSYRRRKERQASILAARHDNAKAFLAEVNAQIEGRESATPVWFVGSDPSTVQREACRS